MHCAYPEIIAAMGDPLWWNEDAVPRYVPFAPHACGDIYAREVALLEIQCQDCRRPFLVCMSSTDMDAALPDHITVLQRITDPDREICWGDPPNVACCAAGPTMTSVTVAIHEVWVRDAALDWRRRPDLERLVAPVVDDDWT